ncbi:MAG: hypothetical protein R3254_01900 [Thiomicrorhabdus sp.]|nr:hypothetical protein [Thiomicrorhabdus sp.]
MDIKANASMIASNGLNHGAKQLNQISQSINQTLVAQNPVTQSVNQNLPPYKEVNYDNLNNLPQNSLEDNLLGLNQTKTQMLALMKVLEVEQENVDASLGKIFDNWV